MTDTAEKQLQRRCPRLGGPVTLHYCRVCDDGQRACFKIVDCWWEIFDVVRYLKDHLSAAEFDRLICAPQPKPKVASLLELADKAQRNQL